MTTYCNGQPGELPAIRDFINMVFSMHQRPHDFHALLPKLYEPGSDTEFLHYLAKEDGEIKAVICVLPITLEYQNYAITCGTVGSVSVHPYSRGKGYMKDLMTMALEDMKKNRMTMSVLSGNRHRYQYYGYEPGGQLLEYRFTPDNFKHCGSRYPSYHLTLTPASKESSHTLWEMHQAQTVHTQRSGKEFLTIGRSWNCTVFIISHQEDILGYLCASGSHIYELVLTDEQYLFSALSAYMVLSDCRSMLLSVAPYQTERIEMLTQLYERWSIREDDNYQIFDYKETLSFFLRVKASIEPLTQADLVLKPANLPNLLIKVSDRTVMVEETDRPEDLFLSHNEMIDLLFSANAHYMSHLYPVLSTVNWFPLPLSIPYMDKC